MDRKTLSIICDMEIQNIAISKIKTKNINIEFI